MEWPGDATIGFKADSDFYVNHALSGNGANSIACQNSPDTTWNNVVYQLRELVAIYTLGVVPW